MHLYRVYLQVEKFSEYLSKMFIIFRNIFPFTGYTNSATHTAFRNVQLVDFIVCYCCCFSAFLSSPVFHPAVTFWCDRQDVSFVLLHFSRWSAGGVRKWRWKRALGRRVYRFTVDTSRGSPQSRVSSATQRDNGMLSKYFKKLRAAPPYIPHPPLLSHPLCYCRRPQSWPLICNEREGQWGEEHDGVGVEE